LFAEIGYPIAAIVPAFCIPHSYWKTHMINRRSFLQGSGAVAGLSAMGLSGCARHATAPVASAAPALPFYDAVGPIIPIRADTDRIFRITVCTRPFRPAGPRQDVERVGDKVVVHNYGHGGSGWSLSWGSADVVVRKVLGEGSAQREVAVIGAGALGLTAALTAQRAGLKVTIYARERAPYVRSVRATGSWTPDSRIALASAAAPDFPAQWEAMARTSFAMYMTYIGAAGTPVEWTDRYSLSDGQPHVHTGEGRDYVEYMDRIADLTPGSHDLPPGATPFPTKYVRRSTSLTFNVADYARQLMTDFLIAGGTIETREFHSPQELTALPQRAIINCTGYAARQLWSDESIVPVRGQIAWLIPQEGVTYGLNYKGLGVLARRDGIVLMLNKPGEDTGWNDSTEVPDRATAEEAVGVLQELYGRMAKIQQAKPA
jgi:glycine/D-amino acid oxidase-like deaminating enzyme